MGDREEIEKNISKYQKDNKNERKKSSVTRIEMTNYLISKRNT